MSGTPLRSRRSFLGLLTLPAMALIACTRHGEAAPAVRSAAVPPETATPEPEPTASPPPPPAPTPVPLSMALPATPIPQGGTFFVVVRGTGIAGVRVLFAGRTQPAAPDGDGWLALVGAGQRVGLTDQHAPGTYDVHAIITLDDGRTHTLAGQVTITATRFPVEYITLSPSEAALLDPALIERETAILREAYGGFTPGRLWEGFFVRPAGGAVTDVFGSRRSFNGGPVSGSHSGVDFGADAGAPVVAAAIGRVVLAQALPVRGNTVILDHGVGVFTGYCHLSAIGVAPGQVVQAGELIGRVGATGLVSGAHLHWEVVVGGYHVNGLLWLHPDEQG
jgi:murein DD-endopeptidase MepM/ murein hydrolase activator NlpD